MNIKWIDKVTNEELWRITQQKLIENQIRGRKKKMELYWTHITQRSSSNRKKQHWIGILRDTEEEVGRRNVTKDNRG
jgi:hypothetical protein